MSGVASVNSDTSTYAQAEASLQVIVNGYRVNVSQGAYYGIDPVYNDFNPGIVQIELGTPFSVSSRLQVQARLQALTAIDNKYTGAALANFGNSAGITSFELFEAGTVQLITDWSLTSESGAFGFYSASAVPVPASI